MDDITAKIDYDGTTTPVPDDAVHKSNEYNDRRSELQNSVTNIGLTGGLDSADANQLSKAMFANGIAAQSMLDSGSVNAVELTPITGASGLRLPVPSTPDYSALNGAILNFKAANTNTGNVTVNIGQTGVSLIGAQPLFLEDGTTQVAIGGIFSGRYYSVRYDSALDVDGAFVLIGRDIPHTGGVVQVVNVQDGAVATGSTQIPLDDTIPQNTEGDEYMSLAITPANTGNKLKIDIVLNISHTSGGQKMSVALFQDSTANALSAMSDSLLDVGGDPSNIKFTHYMVAGTTSSTTFKVRAGASVAGTATFNGAGGGRIFGGIMASSITITEIKA